MEKPNGRVATASLRSSRFEPICDGAKRSAAQYEAMTCPTKRGWCNANAVQRKTTNPLSKRWGLLVTWLAVPFLRRQERKQRRRPECLVPARCASRHPLRCSPRQAGLKLTARKRALALRSNMRPSQTGKQSAEALCACRCCAAQRGMTGQKRHFTCGEAQRARRARVTLVG